MRLYLHPTRREALTVGETTLTRWSLAGQIPSRLCEVSTAPHPLFDILILQDGRIAIYKEATGAPDDGLFALNSPDPQKQKDTDPCVIELRRWETLSLARTITIPQAFGPSWSMASSADGRWLVVATGNPERLFLLDRHTGEVMSRHTLRGGITSGLTFDPTSTFIAGVSSHGDWGDLMLWNLTPSERWVPRMEERPQDPLHEPAPGAAGRAAL